MTLLEEKHRKILENLKIARARFSASFDAASEHTSARNPSRTCLAGR